MPFVPTACAHCQARLPHDPAPGDPEPTWHQVAEVPRRAAILTEDQGQAPTCPNCGHTTRSAIPPEIRAPVVGPNLAAILSSFSGRHHLGKRSLEEVVETVFEVPIALGTVSMRESERSAALAPAHDEAKDAVRAAAVKNTDETGWKPACRRCWLWMAATATVASFVIDARRNVAGLQVLLGEAIQGIVGSDRWGASNKRPLHWNSSTVSRMRGSGGTPSSWR